MNGSGWACETDEVVFGLPALVVVGCGVGGEQVTRAMHALMQSSSNEQRQAANSWLSEFLAQPEAWGAVEQLLSAEESTANLFGAILLHSKIQNDFSQLAQEKYVLALHWRAVETTAGR